MELNITIKWPELHFVNESTSRIYQSPTLEEVHTLSSMHVPCNFSIYLYSFSWSC